MKISAFCIKPNSYFDFFFLQVEPTWNTVDQFVVDELESVLKLDALVSSHPISVEVSDPNEINEIFDGISYSKGINTLFDSQFSLFCFYFAGMMSLKT